ncbi:LysM domain-containing protein [uncultured Pseudokineococcus sp.]|uniref:LysM peptidoglycan-binding domain-containing protein n=1 Tax=uncultured Pseudokineococcus sp. TaxID=1642928 RepID=UPI00260D2F34|nr:LysM domain-containing protein [uncultured Pseudokineococcus sp.]
MSTTRPDPHDARGPASPVTSGRTPSGRGRALLVLLAAAALAVAGVAALAAAVAGPGTGSWTATGQVPWPLAPATTAQDLLVAAATGAAGALATAWGLAAGAVATARLAPGAGAADAVAGAATRLLPAVLRGVLVAALGAGPLLAAGPASAAPAAVAPAAVAPVTAAPVTAAPLAAAPVAAPPVAAEPATTPTLDSTTAAAPGAAPATAAGTDGAPDVTWRPTAPPRPVAPHVEASGGLLVPSPREAATADEAGVVVVRGDTLWDIARRHLPPGADDAEVAAAWPAWYAANRAVVGDDPDRLLPGQRLVPPVATTGGLR